MEKFLSELASKEPIPGGGGAAALVGSIAVALGSMVGNLTTGKKKYAEYQQDIDRILSVLESSCKISLISSTEANLFSCSKP